MVKKTSIHLTFEPVKKKGMGSSSSKSFSIKLREMFQRSVMMNKKSSITIGTNSYSFVVEFDCDHFRRLWTLNGFQTWCIGKTNQWILSGKDASSFMGDVLIEENDQVFLQRLQDLLFGQWVQLKQDGEPSYVRLVQDSYEEFDVPYHQAK